MVLIGGWPGPRPGCGLHAAITEATSCKSLIFNAAVPVWRSRSRCGAMGSLSATRFDCSMRPATTRLGPIFGARSVGRGEEFEARRDAVGLSAAHELARHLDAAQHRPGLVGLADTAERDVPCLVRLQTLPAGEDRPHAPPRQRTRARSTPLLPSPRLT